MQLHGFETVDDKLCKFCEKEPELQCIWQVD